MAGLCILLILGQIYFDLKTSGLYEQPDCADRDAGKYGGRCGPYRSRYAGLHAGQRRVQYSVRVSGGLR